MRSLDKILKAYDRDAPEAESHGWIQWKGTDVCIDLHCVCGQGGHVDGDFMYRLKCPKCGRQYLAGQNITLIELTPEEYAEDFHEPYLIEDN